MIIGKLLGRIFHHLYVSKGEEGLKFGNNTIYGGVAFLTDGDCCSETWFADIVGVKNLLGESITGISLLEVPVVEDGRTRQEEDEFYGFRLTTAKGDCDFIYRNSSNGYYGGGIGEMPEATEKELLWQEIFDDWSA